MRFGFLLKTGKPEAARLADELGETLRKRGCQVLVADKDVPVEQLGRAVDALVVLGGDGTFLYGASLVADHGVPLLGINLGSLGFITQFALAEARAAVEAACDGRLPIDERMRLEITVLADGQMPEKRSALNEAVILRSISRLTDLRTELGGDVITTYKADGLIISTPTGSTAYNLAAQGPILTPDLEAMVLTPICPHTLTNRPVVVRADARLRVTNVSGVSVTLTVDGRWTRELGPAHAIEVCKTPRPLRIFRPQSTFFAILRQKLSWGERQV
jgi:NAD+ kinase